ncbi:hypothetical protein B0T26DRAFT_695646 [Lasiosphaeria miniovina]|uniref:Uncharacterized protein n=1 Tax=Lasiosphaeria miniovina TaxID=1954250 RepID=A0AA40B566_9PEZI|nr:uncharacterized protein B0T26DRAFT_695646 [Lasiosphaeria miniovina]KAK0727757.1 hypothetical protein B0T26DRAFT_695646 [Lasiosphaeria miniovina]
MAPTRLSGVAALAGLLLTAPARAWTYRGFGGYADAFQERVGPYDANSTAFLDAVAASNASGLFRIPGYDVSKPFPGEPADGWTLSVTALDLSQYDYRQADADEAMLGYSLTIQAPEALLVTNPDGTKTVRTDPTWGMCMWSFGHPSHINKTLWNNQANKPLAADGSCKGFLPDACIAALEKRASTSYWVADSAAQSKGPYGSMVSCDRVGVPDECGLSGPGNAGFAVPAYLGVPVPYLNGSVTDSDGWLFEGDVGSYYNSTKDLQDYWDSMVLNFWPLLTVMVNVTVDPNATDSQRGPGFPRMNCISPGGVGTSKAFTFSGVVPGANGTDNGGSTAGGNGGNNTGAAGGGNGGGADDKKNGAGIAHPMSTAVWAVLTFSALFGGFML